MWYLYYRTDTTLPILRNEVVGMRAEQIKREVARLKARFHTTDPHELCDALGILLLEKSMGAKPGSCKGFFLVAGRCKVATINSDLALPVRRLTTFHEAGHGFLHADSGIKTFRDFTLLERADPKELEANVFAAEYMVEDDDLFDVLNQGLDFFGVASTLGVPPEIIDFKLQLLEREGYPVSAPRFSRSDFLKRDVTKPFVK